MRRPLAGSASTLAVPGVFGSESRPGPTRLPLIGCGRSNCSDVSDRTTSRFLRFSKALDTLTLSSEIDTVCKGTPWRFVDVEDEGT